MILSYRGLQGSKRHRIKAVLSTHHPASDHGQPIILLKGRNPVSLGSWVKLKYRVETASAKEQTVLEKMGLL